jgi:serine acetyltransferase
MNKIAMDFDIYHRRRWPGRTMSFTSRLWLLVNSPGLRLLLVQRIAHWLYLKRKYEGPFKCLCNILLIPVEMFNLLGKINSKSHICNDCEINGCIFLSDQGYMILGATAVGSGTMIGTRVTIGMDHVDGGRPKIGHNVWIGSDCVIYGSISIGDGATLLPGTVLSKSIPTNVVIQGNPARLVLRNYDNSELRERQNADTIQYQNIMGA